MLKIEVPGERSFNEVTNKFINSESKVLLFEHSLVSISKWESIWKKPFLHNTKDRTNEEIKSYIKCMCITQNVTDDTYEKIFNNRSIMEKIKAYISDPMTATWFNNEDRKSGNKDIMTSELIYYYMFANQISIECEKWPINRLLTLIRVFGEKNDPKKKKYKGKALYERNRMLNEQRRAKLHSKG